MSASLAQNGGFDLKIKFKVGAVWFAVSVSKTVVSAILMLIKTFGLRELAALRSRFIFYRISIRINSRGY